MRIGLLTLPLETGYGSILQAYALKTVLTRQGHEVILIRRLVKKKRFNGWNILKRSVKKYIFRKPACVFYDKKIYDEYPVITQHTANHLSTNGCNPFHRSIITAVHTKASAT